MTKLRDIAKAAADFVATVFIAPELVSYYLRSALWGRDRALEGSSQHLAIWPGMSGQFLRRAFLRQVLAHCASTATIEFGTLFSKVDARIEARAYIGPNCHLGLVHIGQDVLLAGGVHVPSGPRTHGTTDLQTPIREQAGERQLVCIGAGTWVGSAAVVMADIGRDCVIGAGAVVTKPIPDGVVAVGVPARVIRQRQPNAADDLRHSPAPAKKA